MKKYSLILLLLLCGVVFAGFQELRVKVLMHITNEGYSPQYVRDNAKAVIVEALPDPNDRRALSRCRSIMKSSLVKWGKAEIERTKDRAFLLHIRKAGTDKQILLRMQRLVIDSEVWVNDPNAFLN